MKLIDTREIKKRRIKKGKTIGEMAKDINISYPSLQKIEKGHIPKYQTIKKICDYFGISIGQLNINYKKNSSNLITKINKDFKSTPLLGFININGIYQNDKLIATINKNTNMVCFNTKYEHLFTNYFQRIDTKS